jgi:F-type H+-transporting ATPase subunit delta
MADLKVSRRYAKSLLGLAQEQNLLAKVYEDMQLIVSVCDASRELSLLMRNPIIQNYKKAAVLEATFQGKVNQLSLSFMTMMITKGRVGLIDQIAAEYVALYKELTNVRTAHVTSAVKLDEVTRAAVMTIVRDAAGEKAELVEHVDASLIGGFILRIGDLQVDSSVSRRLSDISRNLYSTAYTRSF